MFKFFFKLKIGDTVNTTSRMCLNSQKNCITLSEVSYKVVNDFYPSKFHFETIYKDIKGKGFMNIYIFDPVDRRNNHRISNGNLNSKVFSRRKRQNNTSNPKLNNLF